MSINRVAKLLIECLTFWGRQAFIARLLGVSQATISNDVKYLRERAALMSRTANPDPSTNYLYSDRGPDRPARD